MSDLTLALAKLSKSSDGVAVLTDISANVSSGEVIGLPGLDGAGITTLLETALGFSMPNGGNARVFDQCSSAMNTLVKARIGFVP